MTREGAFLAPAAADLDWSDPSGPRSKTHDDVYYAAADGLAESRAVFLQGCGLPEAWRGRSRFILGELGFGTGLNLLAVWELWRRARPSGGVLHFVSIEAAPLTAEEMRRAHGAWPELETLSDTLTRRLPPRVKGVHRRRFDADGIVLTLAYLPAMEAFEALPFKADAWFLDGFAPARNADFWSDEVLAAIGARSAPGARAATYTVAGAVRRGLAAAGFSVAKRPGHGRKRERLEAVYAPSQSAPLAARAPFPTGAFGVEPPPSALIIGAGVAGAATARALAQRGVAVTVLDAAATPASAASGNPAALMMPRLDVDDRPPARFLRTAFSFAIDECAQMAGDDSALFNACGVVQLATEGQEKRTSALCEAQALPPDMLRPLTGGESRALSLPAKASGMVLPQAGIVRPTAWVNHVLNASGATLQLGASVARLEGGAEGWRAVDARGAILAQADMAVLACGADLAHFEQTRWIDIIPSRGQVSWATLKGAAPKQALTFGGYALPLGDQLVFGATYAPWETTEPPEASPEDDQANWRFLYGHAPDLAARLDRNTLSGRASIRATTPDRFPYAGPVVEEAAYRAQFAHLAQGRRDPKDAQSPAPPLHPGLFVLGGLGSRAFTHAPLLAEALASALCGEPPAMEHGAWAAVHPARCLRRRLKRGL